MSLDSDYYKNLRQIEQAQDRAKFSSMVALYNAELRRLPKLANDIKELYTDDSLDFVKLGENIKPKLENFKNLINRIDNIPNQLKQESEITNLSKCIFNSIGLKDDPEEALRKFKKSCHIIEERWKKEKQAKLDKEHELKKAKEEAERQLKIKKAQKAAEEVERIRIKYEEEERVKAAQRKAEEEKKERRQKENTQKKATWHACFACIGIVAFIILSFYFSSLSLWYEEFLLKGALIGVAIGLIFGLIGNGKELFGFLIFVALLGGAGWFMGESKGMLIGTTIAVISSLLTDDSGNIFFFLVVAILCGVGGFLIGGGIGFVVSGLIGMAIGKMASYYQDWFEA